LSALNLGFSLMLCGDRAGSLVHMSSRVCLRGGIGSLLQASSRRVLCGVAALSLILAATALAASPKAGSRYSGFTSAPKINGFQAPVSFKVSSPAGKLLSFKYGNTGCPTQSAPGNPYLKSNALTTVGTIPVSSTGTFSAKNVKTTTSSATYVISSVAGKFKSRTTATGSIKINNWFSVPGNTHSCGSSTVTFTATTK
jgi:hypothetical protein